MSMPGLTNFYETTFLHFLELLPKFTNVRIVITG